jgi:hypothetical protein
MISSTARDLPKHRQAVMDACLRQGMFPLKMEHLPASDAVAVGGSYTQSRRLLQDYLTDLWDQTYEGAPSHG